VENLENLIRCDSENLPEHLLGIAFRINRERNQYHSGIFIRYDRQNYIFHFTGEGQKVFLDPPIENDWFFFKTMNNVKFFIPSVFAHFRRIKRMSKPDYFYFYGGGLFDQNGNYQDNKGMPNYMTCVGFCLAALKHSLRGIDFIKFDDWPVGVVKGKPSGFVNNFYTKNIAPNFPEITIEKFSTAVRRITPLEYISAAYSDKIPVPKSFVDNNKDTVKTEIKNRIDNWQDKS